MVAVADFFSLDGDSLNFSRSSVVLNYGLVALMILSTSIMDIYLCCLTHVEVAELIRMCRLHVCQPC